MLHVERGPQAALVAALAIGLLLPGPPAVAGGLPAAGEDRPLLYVSGAAAGAATGDWVSAGDGLDAAYTFRIEVPAGTPELVVELFDADVLAGAGRPGEVDMVRGGVGDSKVRYELYDPEGRRAATRFVTADESGPPGADRAWLTFFSSRAAEAAGERFADAFDAPTYAADDGSRAFSGPWIESGNDPGTGFDGGAIRLEGGRLVISNRGDLEPWLRRPSIERELDLSAFSAAILAFDFTAGDGVDFEDSVLVEASGDGGRSYRVIEELIGLGGGETGRRVYDLSDLISARTRIRFRVGRFYAGPGESLAIDDLEIRAGGAESEGAAPLPGHWRLVVDMSSRLNREAGADARGAGADENGDDVNALGLRAHDGDPGDAGTELSIYAESFLPLGIHGRPGSRQAYPLFPYVTAGCALAVHDFDWDATPGAVAGSLELASRGAHRLFGEAAPAAFSADRAWNRNLAAGWPPAGGDYGIWSLAVEIADLGAGNFGTLSLESVDDGGVAAEAQEPAGRALRVYLPSDRGGAPAKTFLSQSLAFAGGSANPPGPGGRAAYAVTLSLTHPAGAAGTIGFGVGDGAEHAVTATVPEGVGYLGTASTSAGSLLQEPARGGSGELRWHPGTLTPGMEATLVYLVEIAGRPADGAGVTGGPGAGGTRAELLDETGTPMVLGELCGLSVPPASPLPALDPLPEAVAAMMLPHSEAGVEAPAAEPEPDAKPEAPPSPVAEPETSPPSLETATPTPREAAPASPADYRIGAGDVLRIAVFEDPRLGGEYTVGSEGEIIFPLLGEVGVRSRTIGEIQERLKQLLEADYLHHAHVTVTVSAYRSKKVQIQGMVRMPGIYYLEGPTRIFDLLSRAQGLLQAPGEIRAGQIARVVRSGGTTLNVDLHELLVLGNDELNLELEDGDVVYVLRTEEVHVIGEVKRPGSLPYEDGMTVLKALSLAGGATKRGAVKNALVRRIQDGEEVQVKVSVEDLLQPDDILEIPLSFW